MSMEKITPDSPEAQSADLVAENIEKLKSLFPELITEGSEGLSVNVDILKQLVGDQTFTDCDEKYGLNWFGKRRARQLALTPSTGTLRPAPDESEDWDTTQNLFIEGDNLEVLKLLQKSYAGKVKLIYIDPPYNTGKDFVYKDDFRDNIKNYKKLTGQVDEEGSPLTTNTEVSGRFHTDWLNMMYPRLMLARSLLSHDGVMLISSDDVELDNIRAILKEQFGEENFVAQILWKKRSSPPNDKIIGANHDYITVFSRDIARSSLYLKQRSSNQLSRYRNPDNHPKGPWASGDLMANIKGGRYVESLDFPIINPRTGQKHMPVEGGRGNWRFSQEKINELLQEDAIWFGENDQGRPKLKRFLCDVKDGVTYSTIWDFVPLNTNGSREMSELFGNATLFESPKPVGLIQEILKLSTKFDDLVLDFFAGSGTTGHAVMAQNANDGGNRRYILVQLPEPLDPEKKEQKIAAEYCDKLGKPRTIAELTKERLRRAAKKIKEEHPEWNGDTGFRVFKLDSSNIKAWNPHPADLEADLADQMEHILPDRTEADLLYELLLKLGLDLCVPIEQTQIAGKTVHAVGGGVLMACLAEIITTEETAALGLGIVEWHNELSPAGDTTCVFRDSAFENDVAKTNLAAILEQAGIANVRSL